LTKATAMSVQFDREKIPGILQKIDTLITHYAGAIGLRHMLYEFYRPQNMPLNMSLSALATAEVKIHRMVCINWLMVLQKVCKSHGIAYSVKDTDSVEYVEKFHPIYLEASTIRLSLLNKPDKFRPEYLLELNILWKQVLELEKDLIIPTMVMVDMVEFVKNKYMKKGEPTTVGLPCSTHPFDHATVQQIHDLVKAGAVSRKWATDALLMPGYTDEFKDALNYMCKIRLP
jgi:hypothetical protein